MAKAHVDDGVPVQEVMRRFDIPGADVPRVVQPAQAGTNAFATTAGGERVFAREACAPGDASGYACPGVSWCERREAVNRGLRWGVRYAAEGYFAVCGVVFEGCPSRECPETLQLRRRSAARDPTNRAIGVRCPACGGGGGAGSGQTTADVSGRPSESIPVSATPTSVIDSGTVVRLADIFGGLRPQNRVFLSGTRASVGKSGTVVRADTLARCNET